MHLINLLKSEGKLHAEASQKGKERILTVDTIIHQGKRKLGVISSYINSGTLLHIIYTHTHTLTYIYIYIFISTL